MYRKKNNEDIDWLEGKKEKKREIVHFPIWL